MSMEKASQRNLHLCPSLAVLVWFFILDAILIAVRKLHKFCSRSLTCTSSRGLDDGCTKYVAATDTTDFLQLTREAEMVMDRIGLPPTHEGSQVMKLVSSEEFSAMFDENEPSLEEVKEAFCVFDENCDGFIDATELQRVLCKLGFMEGIDLDACHVMIAPHDQNKDGRIDFHEFVKFMENTFC